MYSFGTREPRSLESFGVTGLLGVECRVFYETVFSTAQLGRISDLISARFREVAHDELRLRAVMLFSVFHGFRAQLISPDQKKLDQPLILECGIDDEKLAIGVSFTLPAQVNIELEGLADRLAHRSPQGPFEELLGRTLLQAQRVVLRVQVNTRRVEVVGLMALEGKMDAATLAGAHQLHVIALAETAAKGPAASQYVAMGDLDFGSLLEEKGAQSRRVGPTPKEIIEASEAKQDAENRVGGGRAEKDSSTAVKGRAERENFEKNVIKGESGADVMNAEVTRLRGDNERFQTEVVELQKRIAELEQQKSTVVAGVENSESSQVTVITGSDKKSGVMEKTLTLFKKILRIEKTPDAESRASAPTASKQVVVEQVVHTSNAEDTGSGMAMELAHQLHTRGLDSTISKIQQEAVSMKGDPAHAKTHRWVEGLAGELISERARLNELSKKLNASLRHKEHEFRVKEQTLQQELLRRDETIRSKNAAMMRMKDQSAKLQMMVERMKLTTPAAEESATKHKYMQSQKLLVTSREENAELSKKADDLQHKLDNIHIGVDQSKFDRTSKELDEFKKMNAKLLDSVKARITEIEQLKGKNEQLQTTLNNAKMGRAA